MSRAPLWAFTLVLALAVGCDRVVERAFRQPEIYVRSVKVRSVGLTGGSIEVTLAIANANPYPLPVKRAVYRFAVRDTVEVGRGESAAPFTVPASDSVVVELPVEVSWNGLRAVTRDAARDGAVDYVISGTVTLDTPLGDPNVAFADTGRFVPPPLLQSVR